jgi:SEC-C motif-containing protein
VSGETAAPTAEALMRSRYTAYAKRDFDYILRTTDPQRRYDFDHRASKEWMDRCTFTKLEVLHAEEQGNKGFVEFIAHFRREDGAEVAHHEFSRFR